MDNGITIRDTESLQFNSDILNGDRQALVLNASIQEGQRLSLYMEVLDPGYVADNQEAVAEAVDAFIARIRKHGQAMGLPV